MVRMLVTGANGYIGRNFLEQEFPSDWKIDAIYRTKKIPNFKTQARKIACDLVNQQKIESLLTDVNYDVVLHLASNTNVASSIYNPSRDFRNNLVPTFNLAHLLHFKKFIYFSSGAVYNGYEGQVSPTRLEHEGFKSRIPYAIHKFTGEQYVKSACEGVMNTDNRVKDCSYTIVRFFGGYGKHEKPRKFVNKLVHELSQGDVTDLPFVGDGENVFQIIYHNDLVNALNLMVADGLENNKNLTFDLCSDKEDSYTINQFLQKVQDVSGNKIKNFMKIEKQQESNKFIADNTAFKEYFKWEQKCKLEEGLKDYIEQVRKETYGF